MKEKFTSSNLLKWVVESGQNEVLSESPQNRFSDPDPELKVLRTVPSRKIAPEDKIDFPKNICSFTQEYFSLVVFILNSANQYLSPLSGAEEALLLARLFQKFSSGVSLAEYSK